MTFSATSTQLEPETDHIAEDAAAIPDDFYKHLEVVQGKKPKLLNDIDVHIKYKEIAACNF